MPCPEMRKMGRNKDTSVLVGKSNRLVKHSKGVVKEKIEYNNRTQRQDLG